jgi:hypothetical protein
MNIELPLDMRDPRTLSPDQRAMVVETALERAYNPPVLDSDKAMMAGDRYGRMGGDDADGVLLRYLSRHHTRDHLELVAWYLTGYWKADTEKDPELVRTLLDALRSNPEDRELRPPLVQSLAAAYFGDLPDDLRARIRSAFTDIAARADAPPANRFPGETLAAVLSDEQHR